MKPSSLPRYRLVPLRVAAATAALWGAGACADLARLVSPDGPATVSPARVAFTASVSALTVGAADDVVSLRVTSSYLLANGDKAPIGVQSIDLTSAASQAVPVPVELASCLADANRDGGATSAPCAVVLELALSVNNVVVDRQTVGPLRLAPGATTTVAEPVALFNIASVDVSGASSIALTVGNAATLSTTVRDSRGIAVLGRAVTFSSNTPTVATVDQTGRVTAIAAGTARVTATLGGLSSAVTVTVARAPVALSVGSGAGSGAGVVRSTPAGIECRVVGSTASGVCTFPFAADAQITLTSTADAGQVFSAWGGACAGTAIGGSCAVTMTQAQSASARFTAMRTVSITSTGTDGRGRVSGAFGIDCRIDGAATSGTCAVSVPDGSALLLTADADAAATPRVEQRFGLWAADCAGAVGNSCSVTPSGRNYTVSAGFFDGRRLSLTLDGEGAGRVLSTSVTCIRNDGDVPRTCASTVPHATVVRLAAEANLGSTFGAWGGACAGQGTTCEVTMTQAREATATFARPMALLTVSHSGRGTGTILANGVALCSRADGAANGVACFREFPMGTAVTLTATAGAQSDFAGYAGDCTGPTSCTVVMAQARAVTAAFSSNATVTLRVGEIGGGSGTIVSSESTPRINCRIFQGTPIDPAGCSAQVPVGTTIALIGTGAASSALYAWGGACAGVSTHKCELTLNAPSQVTTTFVAAIDVEMRVSGTGSGTMTFAPIGAPAQAPCQMAALGAAATCRYSLPSGMDGVFRGAPVSGSQFGGILGPCAESVAGEAVAVCTYRGVGFLRVFSATFNRP